MFHGLWAEHRGDDHRLTYTQRKSEERPVVIVTGSSGFIGSAVIPPLSRGHQVIAFDRAPPPHPPPMAECVCIDLADEEKLEAAFDRVRTAYGERLASVVHLAAYYDFSGEPSPLYEEVTVEGTRRLLEALQDFSVDQIVFTSTMLVHRPGRPGEKIDEDSPIEPKWAYPRSKSKTEEVLRDGRGKADLVILRLSGVYDDHGAAPTIAHQIRRLYEDRMTARFYPGDLDAGQSFVHIDDAVDAIVRAVERRETLPEESVLLIGEPHTLDYQDIHRIITERLHRSPRPLHRIPKAVARSGARVRTWTPGDDPFIRPWMVDRADDHYDLDVSKAEEALGWRPEHSLEETLPKMLDHLVEDPIGWYRKNGFTAPSPLRRVQMHPSRRSEKSA